MGSGCKGGSVSTLLLQQYASILNFLQPMACYSRVLLISWWSQWSPPAVFRTLACRTPEGPFQRVCFRDCFLSYRITATPGLIVGPEQCFRLSTLQWWWPPNWTLLDQDSLAEARVENYLVLRPAVTRELHAPVCYGLFGFPALAPNPFLLFPFSPGANQNTIVYTELPLDICCSSPKWAPVFRKLFSHFANLVSLFPVFYSFISTQQFPYLKVFHFFKLPCFIF